MSISSFPDSILRKVADVIANAVSHSECAAVFQSCGIAEQGGDPKWERILLALSARQQKDRCGNNVGAFIEAVLAPVRFADRQAEFENFRSQVNVVLAFSGLTLGENGRLRAVPAAQTLSEAHERADRLRAELNRRRVHGEVLRFCRPELLQNNYFHAVLEATKSVAERLRSLTGLTDDGFALVDQTLSGSQPPLAINRLVTESEQSEQRGFATLVKGMFGTFRNVTAHAPKVTWPIAEHDALDLLSLVSYIHRRLDHAVRTPWSSAKP